MRPLPSARRLAPILAADRVYDGVDLVPFVEGQAKGVPHDALIWRRQSLVSIRKDE